MTPFDFHPSPPFPCRSISKPLPRDCLPITLGLVLILILLRPSVLSAAPPKIDPACACFCLQSHSHCAAFNLPFPHGFSEFSYISFLHPSLVSSIPSSFSIMAPKALVPVAVPLILHRQQPRPQFPNQGYLPNGTTSGPTPGAQALLPNNGRIIQSGPIRVLCIADVRGKPCPSTHHLRPI